MISNVTDIAPMTSAADIIQIAVPLPLRRKAPLVYDYKAGIAQGLPLGTIVKVPLGKREVWGIIMALGASKEVREDRLKEVSEIADCPALAEAHLRFLKSVSQWTLAPFGMVMKMMLSTPKAFDPPIMVTHYKKADSTIEARLTPKRARILSFLDDGLSLDAQTLASETGTSPAIIKNMAQAGLLASYDLPKIHRLPEPVPDFNPVTLSDEQAEIAQAIAHQCEEGYSAHLIDGVTGSGKTEIYFHLVAEQIRAQKQVMILLPEIALTTAWQSRFEARFGVKPLIWHSSVSASQRRHIWRAALEGQPMVVVGARSALFLPFTNLGLIIIDEEHEQAFKQEDMVFYHARDMAVMRAHIEQVPIILATATPSLESWVNAKGDEGAGQARYHYWQLRSRIGGAHLPDIEMVDLKKDKPPAGRWLSTKLIKHIETALNQQSQTLLYLNRRGYAPLSICEACGDKGVCSACDSWLVTHRLSGSRQCHHCGYRQPLRNECQSCGTEGQMRAYGPGVERLAEEVGMLFPEARYCIFSSDTASRPEVAAEMIRAITENEVDIIIGTQMAAKGHHFPHLSLVGIVDADLGLAGGDLRAAERTYQILSQASGRAGRAHIKGKALLQSYEPDNAVFTALTAQDRDAFLALETDMRRQAFMPPFAKLAAVILSAADISLVEGFAAQMAAQKPHYKDVDIFGPAPAPIARIRGRHRIRFLIRTPKDVDIQQILRDWTEKLSIPSGILLQIDIDPYNFL